MPGENQKFSEGVCVGILVAFALEVWAPGVSLWYRAVAVGCSVFLYRCLRG